MTTLVLWVEDVRAASEFYGALLGGQVNDASDEFVNVSSDHHIVLLHKIPAEHAQGIASPPVVRAESVMKPVFDVESIEKARDAVAHTQGKVNSADSEQNYGGTIYCDGFDVEGNVIQLAQIH